MARCVFFSFHYQRDVWRVNQIRNIHHIVGCSAAGFQDKSLWEKAKTEGDAAVHRLIDAGLAGTSVTVVCIGHKTAGRKYINYEIDESLKRRNGIVALRIHHLRSWELGAADPPGDVPFKLRMGGFPVYDYRDADQLAYLIETAAKAAGR